MACMRWLGLQATSSRRSKPPALAGGGVTSHGLRRTANDLLRRIATGEVTRAIVAHATTAMTEHYSHVDRNEKKRAMEGVLRLVTGAGNTSQQAADQNRQLARQLPSETGNSEEAASLK